MYGEGGGKVEDAPQQQVETIPADDHDDAHIAVHETPWYDVHHLLHTAKDLSGVWMPIAMIVVAWFTYKGITHKAKKKRGK